LVLLDINLPKLNGHEVLEQLKQNEHFKHVPVIILSTSSSEMDILKSYKNHANCFITKPVEIDEFVKAIESIEDFWFSIVKLPRQ
jgi:DNA-binding response OmpR family regulator